MKLNFTLCGLLTVLFFGFNSLSGQQANALFVDAPAEIAGIYSAYQATPVWGRETENEEGKATFVIDGEGQPSDGCSIPIENVQGKIAFVDRSSCEMADQALNAQQSGATVVIICNDRPALGIQNMHLEDAVVTDQVTIPVFAMSFYDCQTIRAYAEGGEIDARLSYYCEATPDPDVLWGNEPGQGDFSNGLGDWYVVNDNTDTDTTWAWTTDRVIEGAYSMNRYVVEGTACNGYMLFPSDYYDNNNMTDATGQPIFGAGICPNSGNTGSFCVGSLYSPIIDLSGQNVEGLFCRFYHDWGYYYAGSTTLIASYDGGLTWPDSTHITLGELAAGLNPEVTITGECQVATASVNERGEGTYNIPLLNYNGEPSVQLQFRHHGGYYHATIDDVVLISGSGLDLSVERSFVGRAPAGRVPASQANNIPFHVDVYNTGNLTATDVAIKAEVFGPDGSLVWDNTNDTYRDQPPFCFLNENNSFKDVFLPEEGIEGSYRARYTNITPNDGSEVNDTISFGWEMTKNIWAPVTRPIIDSEEGTYNQMYDGLLADDPNDPNFPGYKWALAYTFYLPNGDGNFLNTVRFGVNALSGNSGDIKAYLFLWDPEEGQSFPVDRSAGQYIIANSDLSLLGCMGENSFGEKVNSQPMNAILQQSIDQTDMTIKMAVADPATGTPKFDSEGNLQNLVLQDDQMYALVFVMNPSQDNELEFIAADSGAGAAADLSATNFALDTLGYRQRYGASTTGLTNGGDWVTELSTMDWAGGYFGSNQPWIEMEILPNQSSTENIADPSTTSIEVFPNPTSNLLYVDINLQSISPKATFELMNTSGELVKRELYSDVKRGRYILNLEDLPSGVYNLNVRTEAGFMSKKVVLAR